MAFNRVYNSQNVQQQPTFQPLPAGEYPVKIVEAADKVSKSCKDMIELKVEVASGPHKGARLYYYIVDDQYADQRIYDVLSSCGIVPIPRQINSATFRGLSGRVKTKLEMYNGEQRPAIHYWMKPAPGTLSTPPPADTNTPSTNPNDVPF